MSLKILSTTTSYLLSYCYSKLYIYLITNKSIYLYIFDINNQTISSRKEKFTRTILTLPKYRTQRI